MIKMHHTCVFERTNILIGERIIIDGVSGFFMAGVNYYFDPGEFLPCIQNSPYDILPVKMLPARADFYR